MADETIEQWEDHFEQGKRESRQERKRATQRDRSKFKKTDQQKRDKQEEPKFDESLPRGRVLSVTAQGAVVRYDEGDIICVARGSMYYDRDRVKNLVTVGDFVRFSLTFEEEGVIEYVEPRSSVLSRADALGRRQEQLIAANIDQVLITVAVVKPLLKPFLVDRYIIAARKGNMEPVIVVNKIDLLDDTTVDPIIRQQESDLLEEFLTAYQVANVPVISISALTGVGMDQLHAVMKDKSSVFSGQSGVGKSSLINAVTGLHLKVGDIVERTRKGAHTTTSAHLVPLEQGGFCVDTPGIKSFGLWELKKEEIKGHFTEFTTPSSHCQFPNCAHLHEVHCGVKEAVEQGTISKLRYSSYEWLMNTLDTGHRRR